MGLPKRFPQAGTILPGGDIRPLPQAGSGFPGDVTGVGGDKLVQKGDGGGRGREAPAGQNGVGQFGR